MSIGTVYTVAFDIDYLVLHLVYYAYVLDVENVVDLALNYHQHLVANLHIVVVDVVEVVAYHVDGVVVVVAVAFQA